MIETATSASAIRSASRFGARASAQATKSRALDHDPNGGGRS